MISENYYEYDNTWKNIKTCKVCGHKHSVYYGKEKEESGEEFLQVQKLYVKKGKRYPSIEEMTVYACPKCGVLQIEVE